MQKPTVGRIVHYTPTAHQQEKAGPGPWAALVTLVSAIDSIDGVPLVNLFVWSPSADFLMHGTLGVVYSEEPKPGCWSWPPRV